MAAHFGGRYTVQDSQNRGVCPTNLNVTTQGEQLFYTN